MSDFSLTNKFLGFASSPEITNQNLGYLAPGSKNVVIDNANRVVSRAGIALYGAAAGANTGPIRSSYEWDTAVSRQVVLRSHYDFDVAGVLEFTHADTWYTLKTGLSGVDIEFAEWWDATERIARLLMCLGDSNIYSWGGGVAKVASSTAVSITMQGVVTARTTISFVAGVANVTPATILDSANGFVIAGFAAGDIINVTGSTGNSRTFQVGSVTAGVITLIMANILTTEAAGPAVTINNGQSVWNSQGAGFTTTGSIMVGGVAYPYTGGANTDTLTGLVGLPAITAGTVVFQSVQTHANPGAIYSGYKNDYIAVEENQLWIGSKTSRNLYLSQNTDFTNFTIPATRAPGDPGLVRMDNFTTKILSLSNVEKSASVSNLSATIICGGTSDFVKIEFRMSSDNTKELLKPRKMKSDPLSGIIGRGAICGTHSGTAYISSEPVMDFLERIEGEDRKPLSDIIKPTFEAYNFTDVHMAYTSRAIGIALPAEGIVLIYDLVRNLWQPPQYMPVSRIGHLKDGSMIGHSSLSAETYTLFTGTNDLDVFIPHVATFPYANAGERGSENKFSRYWTDGYITANGSLDLTVLNGFAGGRGEQTKTILGTDPKTVQAAGGVGLGQSPLGFNPFGGAPLEAQVNLLRLTVGKKFPLVNKIESQISYSMNVLDAQFVIVSHGPEYLGEGDGTLISGLFID